MLPDREGRFKASIVEYGVAETGPNRLATFICRFSLTQELAGSEWMAVDENLDITGYFYLEKRDGSINTVTVDQLKSAFGWDGRDPLWLQDADFSELVVQVKLEFELYEGKPRLKVRYVDAAGATPAGVPRADEGARRALSTRLGSKLRALAGGTPAQAPKPAGRPTTPAAPAKPAVPAKSAPATAAKTATMQQAWEVFARQCPQGWPSKEVEKEWFRILAELFPGKAVDSLSPADWALVLEQAPGHILPL
jgi:hypothetical protein